jgi:hypothetical protein
MVAERKYIIIDDKPELIDLAENILDNRQPVALRLAGVDVAIVGPISKNNVEETVRTRAEFDKNALMMLAGAWADVDTDSLVEEIYERRTNSGRRSIER